jgi:hypothetical protein
MVISNFTLEPDVACGNKALVEGSVQSLAK